MFAVIYSLALGDHGSTRCDSSVVVVDLARTLSSKECVGVGAVQSRELMIESVPRGSTLVPEWVMSAALTSVLTSVHLRE